MTHPANRPSSRTHRPRRTLRTVLGPLVFGAGLFSGAGLLSSCSTSDDAEDKDNQLNGGDGGSDGSNPDAGTGPGPSGSPNGSGGNSNEPNDEPRVRFVGRFDESDPDAVKFAWSGSGVVARFSGTELAVRLEGGQQYTVVVDGEVRPTLIPTGGADTIADSLAAGEHEVEIYRRTEASQGTSVFGGFEFGDGELLPPPPAKERRIEIIGDSITCGYGNEGEDMNCGFTPDTENHYLTYGAIAARELDAELSTVAWSGKGVVCNYGDDANSCLNPLPAYYERVLPNSATEWDFSRWQAHAVVINLSTNDFSTGIDPTREEFETGYVALLEQVRQAYPEALILCTVGPMLSGGDLMMARAYIQNSVDARIEAGDERVTTFELTPQDGTNGYGCDWHPNLRTHELMAEELIAVLQSELNWAE